MDQLWTPWRFAYVTTADGAPRPGIPASLSAWPGDHSCVFCNLISSIDYAIANGMSRDQAEEAGGLVLRGFQQLAAAALQPAVCLLGVSHGDESLPSQPCWVEAPSLRKLHSYGHAVTA